SKALAERVRGERFAVDDEYVRARLVRLREYIGLLQDLKGVDRQKFKADPKLYGLAQWYLQQAVELAFGTGAYFIAALALPKPERGRSHRQRSRARSRAPVTRAHRPRVGHVRRDVERALRVQAQQDASPHAAHDRRARRVGPGRECRRRGYRRRVALRLQGR